ncbi:DUF192 domain-containing protein [Candidatus Woesearchaeota archaeon]|nr:DUF192 domain-containing protein [Candidatus Woesearchaeota archaeon]
MKVFVKGKLISSKLKVCDSFFSRAKGLMFASLKDKDGAVLVFDKETFVSIHMFFVFFPLDVFWVDSNFRVVDARFGVKPFSPLVMPKGKAMYVVEARCGLVKGANVGSRVKLSF